MRRWAVALHSAPPSPTQGAIRIVRLLAQLYQAETPSRLKRAVLEGQVTVNGNVVDDPGTLVPGEAAVVFDPNRKIRRRVDNSVSVLYDGEDAVAVLKPAGLLTHPTEAKEKDTLVSRVSTWLAKKEKGRPFLAVVHRLDRDTSGVIAFARTRRGLASLQAQLKAHTADRRYLAVVEGDVEGESGVFRWEMVEDRGDRRRGVARPGSRGIPAVTEWRVLDRFRIATLVEVSLRTGRTHQVRVHFAHAGHPLVGEPIYRDPSRRPFAIPFARQALHAARLGWTTPTGEKILIEAPPPPDFAGLVATLRARKTKRAAPIERPAVASKPAAVRRRLPK